MLPAAIGHLAEVFWKLPGAFKIAAGIALFGFGKRWWQERQQRLLAEEGKNWPTYKGRVIAVQAIKTGGNEETAGWEGLLTYSYFVDEIEIGEYRQAFTSENEVDEWVRNLREKTVTIAVDPKDKKRSVWTADESAAARAAAVSVVNAAEPEQLSSWVELLRQIAFWAAVIGACTVVWFEALEIVSLYNGGEAPYGELSWWFAGFAIASSLFAAYVFHKRFPGRSMAAVADQFSDPAVKFFLKVLGFLETSVFIWYWLHWGGVSVIGKLASTAVFSAVWAGVFAAASMGLWVSGPRLQRPHELTPARSTAER